MGAICDWKLFFGRFHDLLIRSCKLAYLRPPTETMAFYPGRKKTNRKPWKQQIAGRKLLNKLWVLRQMWHLLNHRS